MSKLVYNCEDCNVISIHRRAFDSTGVHRVLSRFIRKLKSRGSDYRKETFAVFTRFNKDSALRESRQICRRRNDNFVRVDSVMITTVV